MPAFICSRSVLQDLADYYTLASSRVRNIPPSCPKERPRHDRVPAVLAAFNWPKNTDRIAGCRSSSTRCSRSGTNSGSRRRHPEWRDVIWPRRFWPPASTSRTIRRPPRMRLTRKLPAANSRRSEEYRLGQHEPVAGTARGPVPRVSALARRSAYQSAAIGGLARRQYPVAAISSIANTKKGSLTRQRKFSGASVGV